MMSNMVQNDPSASGVTMSNNNAPKYIGCLTME